MRENTGICVSIPRASRHSLGWKRVGTRSLDESVLNKTIREKESKRQTPAHLEFGLVNSHSSSFLWGPLRRAGKGKGILRRQAFLAAQTDKIRRVWTHTHHPWRGGMERGQRSLGCPERSWCQKGKSLCCLPPKSVLTSHISHGDTHAVTLAQLQAPSNRTQSVTKSYMITLTYPHSHRHPVHSAANMQSQPHTHSPQITQSQPHNHRFSTLPPSHTMSHKVIRTHTITVPPRGHSHTDTHSAAHYHSHTPTTRISSHISTKSSAHGHRHNDTPTTGTDNHTRTHGAAQSRKVTIAHMESHTSCPLPQPNQLTQARDSGPAQTVPSDPQGLT